MVWHSNKIHPQVFISVYRLQLVRFSGKESKCIVMICLILLVCIWWESYSRKINKMKHAFLGIRSIRHHNKLAIHHWKQIATGGDLTFSLRVACCTKHTSMLKTGPRVSRGFLYVSYPPRIELWTLDENSKKENEKECVKAVLYIVILEYSLYSKLSCCIRFIHSIKWKLRCWIV